jgi:hypothetical protein
MDGFHPTLDSKKILDLLKDYLKTGARPPPGLSAHILEQLPNIDPNLRETHYLLADVFAKLPEEFCPYNRDVNMRSVLGRLCTKMSTVKHQSIEQMLPILQEKLMIVGKNIEDHNEFVIVLLKNFLSFINAYVNDHKFNTKEILRLVRSNSDFFAIILRPLVQFTFDTINSASENPCVVERLHFGIDAVHQMIALMSNINHTVVGRIFSEFEIFNRRQREAMVLFYENITNMLSNLGNRFVSYVAGRPFDMIFLDRTRSYLDSKSCPISWRPVVEATIGMLQGLPAMVCRDCQHEHVVQKVNELILIVQNMHKSVPGAVLVLENIISSLEQQRSQRMFELFMTIMVIRRILQNVNQH